MMFEFRIHSTEDGIVRSLKRLTEVYKQILNTFMEMYVVFV